MTNNNEVRDAVSPDRTLYDRALRASGRVAEHAVQHDTDGVLLGGGVAP